LDFVAMRLSGPFGPSSERIWNFDVILVVGMGMNITPFASILRSVQQRARQRAEILAAAGKTGTAAVFGLTADREANLRASRTKRSEKLHGTAPPEEEAPHSSLRTLVEEQTHGMAPGARDVSDPFAADTEESPLQKALKEEAKEQEHRGNQGRQKRDQELLQSAMSRAANRMSSRSMEKPIEAATSNASTFPSKVGAALDEGIAQVSGYAGAGREGLTKKKGSKRASTAAGKDNMPGAEELIRTVIPVPRQLHFHWIIRKQAEFDWFYDLLQEAVEGPAKDVLDVQLYVAPGVDASQAKTLSCAKCQQVGEPNWSGVFTDLKEQHASSNVGVFLCGSSSLSSEIAYECRSQSDPAASGEDGTSFVFCREHF
jgi:hypothetical protein